MSNHLRIPAILFALAMMLTTLLAVSSTPTVDGLEAWPIRGYVFNETGAVVDGATVYASNGAFISDEVITADGAPFVIDGSTINVGNGDTVTVYAIFEDQSGSNESEQDFSAWHEINVTLGEGVLDTFLVTFFGYDGSGVGVENATVIVYLGGVAVRNLTLNESGIATCYLLAGDYTFDADPNSSELFSWEGVDFSVVDDAKTVLIDFSERQHHTNLLGEDISANCLLIFVIGLGVAIILLLLGHGKMNGKGSLDGKIVFLLIVVALVALVMADAVDLTSLSSILSFFGLSYGTLGVTSIDVGVYLLMMATIGGSIIAALGGLSMNGGGRKTLMVSLLLGSLTCWTFLLVPGFPHISYYAFAIGLIGMAIIVAAHIWKTMLPDEKMCAWVSVIIGIGISLAAAFALYYVIGGHGTLFTVGIVAGPASAGFLGLLSKLKDSKAASGLFPEVSGSTKEHLWWVFAVLGVGVLCLSIYGAVQVADDPTWMVANLVDSDWHPYVLAILVGIGVVGAFALGSNYKKEYRAWWIFITVAAFVLASVLYLYWYKVLPFLGLGLVGVPALWQKKDSIRKNIAGAASAFTVAVFVGIVVLAPMAMIWYNNNYGPIDDVVLWLEFVAAILIGYAGSYVFKLHQK
jgi:hypothetical protein